MVFTILQGCLSYSNDWNIRDCECTYGTYGSYYAWPYTLVSPYQSLNVYIYKNRLWTLPIDEPFNGLTTYTSILMLKGYSYISCAIARVNLMCTFLDLQKWTTQMGPKCSCIKTSSLLKQCNICMTCLLIRISGFYQSKSLLK